ncbi:MAG: hypothetical protein MZU84_04405 [Sphingobacterium sp.]|nr:hypothetical protein [Sphingobacterium sp.]
MRGFEPDRDAAPFLPFVHRWVRGRDIVALLVVLRHMLDTAGTLEQFFLDGDDPAAPDIGPGLESFCARARAVDVRPAYGLHAARPGAHAFFPLPSGGERLQAPQPVPALDGAPRRASTSASGRACRRRG